MYRMADQVDDPNPGKLLGYPGSHLGVEMCLGVVG